MTKNKTHWLIKTRVLIAITIPAVFITLTLMIYFLVSQTKLIEEQIQENGSQLSHHIALMSEFSLISENTTSLKSTLNTLIKDSNIITVEVLDKNGTPLLTVRNMNLKDSNSSLSFSAPVYITLEGTDEFGTEDLALNVTQTAIGSVKVNMSLFAIESKRNNIVLATIVLSVLTLIVSLLLGNRLVRSIVKPIAAVIEVVHKLSSGNYKARIHATEVDVLGKLATGIDQLAENLESAKREVNTQMLELTEERQKADHANAAKSRFLALMSHELRDPLSAINANLEVLDDLEIPQYQRRFIDVSKISLEQLLRLVQDILDFSQAAAGKLTMSPKPFSLGTIIDNVLSIHQPAATKKGLALDVAYSIDDSLTGSMLVSDPTRIQQVLINILGNAVKYTNIGCISLEVTLRRIDNKKVMLSVAIRDTGIGIPKDQLSNIFELFEQVASPTDRSEGGSGLGLAITKLVADALGGEIRVRSELGQGSTFIFEVEVERLTAAYSESRETISMIHDSEITKISSTSHHKRVLLVEDNPCNQIAVKGLMKNIGIDIDIAGNGIEGLNLFKKVRHELIFVDCFMPGMDGLEFAQKVRQIEKAESDSGQRCLLIAVTAWSQSEMKEMCFNAGIDDIIVKPFSKFELYARVKQVMLTETLFKKSHQVNED